MDQIYVVDPASKKLGSVPSVSLAEIGIKERADLEVWVVEHPQVLGENLFIITSEFDRFDRSARRLDVLALDNEGVLVVIELKLELTGTYADQQAIRYAAFCSTMTMDEVVRQRAQYFGGSEEESAASIRTFLNVDELPELNDRPRIILAAGSLDDAELTSAVLWLRSFGVDISCVELTPYRLSDGSLILVPRTIIPIPEARDYMIRVERKEVKKSEESKHTAQYRALWRSVGDAFNALGTEFRTTGNSGATYLQVTVGHGSMHYEWIWRKRAAALDVCLHFEWPDGEKCARAVERIRLHQAEITRGIEPEFFAGPFGARWTEARFRIPFDGNVTNAEVARRAADTMKLLIERTYSIVQQIRQDEP